MNHTYAPLKKGQKTIITWFSGTGSTKYVAEEVSKAIALEGIETHIIEMRHDQMGPFDLSDVDFLFVLFAVHAFGAPELVHRWLKNLPIGSGTKAVVLSVSGGGEVWPNTSCRSEVIKSLEKKEYPVVYERMLVMPCNMLLESEPDLLSRLMAMLPLKIEDIKQDLLGSVVRRSPLRLSQVFLSPISALERKGVKGACKNFEITEKCSHCGHCMKACPAGNIKENEQGIPEFGENCLLCLRCIYSCPAHAIEAPKYKKWLVSAYDMKTFESYKDREPQRSIDECCKSLVWLGVKRYLKNIKY